MATTNKLTRTTLTDTHPLFTVTSGPEAMAVIAGQGLALDTVVDWLCSREVDENEPVTDWVNDHTDGGPALAMALIRLQGEIGKADAVLKVAAQRTAGPAFAANDTFATLHPTGGVQLGGRRRAVMPFRKYNSEALAIKSYLDLANGVLNDGAAEWSFDRSPKTRKVDGKVTAVTRQDGTPLLHADLKVNGTIVWGDMSAKWQKMADTELLPKARAEYRAEVTQLENRVLETADAIRARRRAAEDNSAK